MTDIVTRTLGRVLRDCRITMSLLTILPAHAPVSGTVAASAWLWPIAGAAIGALAGSIATLLVSTDMPPLVAASLAVAMMIVLTGGLHEDGLADCADGLPNGSSPGHRIEIMHDSNLGTYGVLSLIVIVLLRILCIAELLEWNLAVLSLAVTGALSRAAMALVMFLIPPATGSGLSSAAGQPPFPPMLVGIGFAMLMTLILVPWQWLPLMAASAPPVILFCLYARRRIGGQNGDVIGAVQQLTETFCLITILPALLIR